MWTSAAERECFRFCQRLIGEGKRVGEFVVADVLLDLFFAAAAADEKEAEVGIGLESDDSVEDRGQRIAGAVVAAVHDDEFAGEIVAEAEGIFGIRDPIGRSRCCPRGARGA